MSDIQCYAILVSVNNVSDKLFSQEVIRALKNNKGAAVMGGYNVMKYVTCLVFKTRLNRDRCAQSLEQLGIEFDTRDDAIIPEKDAKGW